MANEIKTVPVTTILPEHIANALDEIAVADRRSTSNYIRVLVEEHLESKGIQVDLEE